MANSGEPPVTSTANEVVYQFKISLQNSRPPVWRRIQVPEYFSFKALHLAIQKAMGWSGVHLHLFRINEIVISKMFGNPNNEFCDCDEKTTFIKDYFKEPKQKGVYEYDLGFSWMHNIVLEKILPAKKDEKYPKCLTGRRACPVEDPQEDYEEVPEEEERFSPKHIFDDWDNSKFLPSNM